MYLPGFYSPDHCILYRYPCWHFEDASLPSGTKSPAWSLALLFHSGTCRESTRWAAKQRHWGELRGLLSTLLHTSGLPDAGLHSVCKQAGINKNTAQSTLGEWNNTVLHPMQSETEPRQKKGPHFPKLSHFWVLSVRELQAEEKS